MIIGGYPLRLHHAAARRQQDREEQSDPPAQGRRHGEAWQDALVL